MRQGGFGTVTNSEVSGVLQEEKSGFFSKVPENERDVGV